MTRFATWIQSLRFPERSILFALLFMAVTIWAFIEISDTVSDGEITSFDQSILMFLRQPENLHEPRGPAWLHQAAIDITALGGGTVITLVSGAVILFFWLQRKYGLMILVIVSISGGALLTTFLKDRFQRERPSLVPHLAEVTSPSYPSGHSTLSTITFLTLASLLARSTKNKSEKIYFIVLAVLLSFFIGLSRIYLGVHYPTDVLAGWCTGIVWALACVMTARWLQQKGNVEPPESAS